MILFFSVAFSRHFVLLDFMESYFFSYYQEKMYYLTAAFKFIYQ